MGIERRKNPRYRIDMPVVLHVGGGGHTLPCRSWDLSCAGIFLLIGEEVGSHSRVELALIDEEHDETLFLAGVVAHVAAGRGVGIRFGEQSTRQSGRLVRLLERLASEGPPMDPLAPIPLADSQSKTS